MTSDKSCYAIGKSVRCPRVKRTFYLIFVFFSTVRCAWVNRTLYLIFVSFLHCALSSSKQNTAARNKYVSLLHMCLQWVGATETNTKLIKEYRIQLQQTKNKDSSTYRSMGSQMQTRLLISSQRYLSLCLRYTIVKQPSGMDFISGLLFFFCNWLKKSLII